MLPSEIFMLPAAVLIYEDRQATWRAGLLRECCEGVHLCPLLYLFDLRSLKGRDHKG